MGADSPSITQNAELTKMLEFQAGTKDFHFARRSRAVDSDDRGIADGERAAKQAHDKQISLLRTELLAQIFDKEKYLRGLESLDGI
ncbi:MAG: hypothetical protein J5722_08680 [Oscillospiraceae bacterium]|nr:hypothetical protein [Oscillospiraceae bacterium]